MRLRPSLSTLAGCFLLVACARNEAPLQLAPPPLGLEPVATYAAYLAAEPARVKMRHEVESSFGERTDVIAGFFVLERPDRFLVHARSPMGPALFEVKSVPPAPLAVTTHLRQLEDQRFARYLARDIFRIYVAACPAEATAVADSSGVVVRCGLGESGAASPGDEGPDDTVELRLGPGAELLEKSFFRSGAPTATVRYRDHRQVSGVWLPHDIRLTHASLPYRLRVALVSAEIGFDTSRVFGSTGP